MSTKPITTPTVNPTSFRFPFELKGHPEEIVAAHRYAFSGLIDANNGIASLKSQIDSLTAQLAKLQGK